MSYSTFELVFSGVSNQSLGLIDFFHDFVTHIDTGCAANALVLQAITDINAGRANLYTESAVYTVTKSGLFCINAFLASSAWFTAIFIVGNQQRVLVEHNALETRIRAHVNTNLFTQPAGITVGGKTIKQDPEDAPGADIADHDVTKKRVYRCKPAHESEAGEQREQQPGSMLATGTHNAFTIPWTFVELHLFLS